MNWNDLQALMQNQDFSTSSNAMIQDNSEGLMRKNTIYGTSGSGMDLRG